MNETTPWAVYVGDQEQRYRDDNRQDQQSRSAAFARPKEELQAIATRNSKSRHLPGRGSARPPGCSPASSERRSCRRPPALQPGCTRVHASPPSQIAADPLLTSDPCRCTGMNSGRLGGRCNSRLAKVGVVGSNPITRSSIGHAKKPRETAATRSKLSSSSASGSSGSTASSWKLEVADNMALSRQLEETATKTRV